MMEVSPYRHLNVRSFTNSNTVIHTLTARYDQFLASSQSKSRHSSRTHRRVPNEAGLSFAHASTESAAELHRIARQIHESESTASFAGIRSREA